MITLSNDKLKIQINPDLGAALHQLTYHDIDILRPTPNTTQTPQDQSLFLMLPYCSYIKGGRFNYFGISRLVSTSDSQVQDPIHGDGWKAKWGIEAQTNNNATLFYKHTKDNGFPFDYTAKVTYTLEDNQLKITLSVHNPSGLPMPCGMGVHPYFMHPQTAQISFTSSHIWHHKNDPIFDRPYPTPKEWDFAKERMLSEDFDTAFGGWDGHASITYPDQKVKVSIDGEDIFHHIVLYSPKGADFFCLEPVSNTPDAFNLAAYGVIGTGIQSIGGGQTLTKTICFTCDTV